MPDSTPPEDDGRRLATMNVLDARDQDADRNLPLPPLPLPQYPPPPVPLQAPVGPPRPQQALPPQIQAPPSRPQKSLPASIGSSANATGGVSRIDKINGALDTTNLASTLTDLSLQTNAAYTGLSGNSTGNPWDVGSVNPGIRLPNDWHQGVSAPTDSHTQDGMSYAAQNPGLAAVGAVPFAEIAAFNGIREGGEGMWGAAKEMHGARKTGDVRRGVEGGGQFLQSGLGLASSAWNGMSGLATAGWETTHALAQASVHTGALDAANGVLGHATTIASQHVPILSLASGAFGMAKSGYQGVDAMMNMHTLSNMREDGGDGGSDDLMQYAHDSQRKRRNRAGINLTSSILTTAGGAMTLSGLGAGFGTATAATGTAVKYGALGMRKAKQAARDNRESRQESGKSGVLGSVIDKVFDPNVEKSTGKKQQKLDHMTASLTGDANGREIFKAIGANKRDLERFEEDPNNPKVQAKIRELFQRRE